MAGAFLSTGRMAAYGTTSTMAATAVVLTALHSRSNFYSAAVMLGRSNGGMLVLLNFAVYLTLAGGRFLQKLFFGPLRAVETEHLQERMWYAITESLLALTIFRSEFDASFVILFGSLLLLKAFHWLTADRVDFMEQTPTIPRFFHIRMASVQFVLLTVDLLLVGFTIEVVLLEAHRMGMMIMFASEFSILLANILSITAKYIINCIDLRSEEPWEGKSMWVFTVDLITDFLKLCIYVTFFAMILTFYGLPLNIIRDVYMTGRSFFNKIRDLVRYRAATRNMDNRYPSATAADMNAMSDGTCIICREDMVVEGDPAAPPQNHSNGLNHTPKKLPCGHIFHFHCLRAWLERQQSCPTCRRTVFTEGQPQPPPQQQPQPQAPQQDRAPQGPVPPPPRPGQAAAMPAGAMPTAAPQLGSNAADILARTLSPHSVNAPASGSSRNGSRSDLEAFFRSHGPAAPPAGTPAAAPHRNGTIPEARPVLRDPESFRAALPLPDRLPTINNGRILWRERSSLAAPDEQPRPAADADEDQVPDYSQLDPREAVRLATARRFMSQQPSQKAREKQPESRSTGVVLTPIEPEPAIPLAGMASLLGDNAADISDVQLQQMSRMTREGIQERLRVLHQIDQQIWDSVQELTRCLSVLPSDTTPGRSPSLQPTAEASRVPPSEL